MSTWYLLLKVRKNERCKPDFYSYTYASKWAAINAQQFFCEDLICMSWLLFEDKTTEYPEKWEGKNETL